jgi:50S ribosomal protein L16 3-hydroxylase
LLVRAALPGFVSPIDRETLFELAARDEVESRLVITERGRPRLQRGPFEQLPSVRRTGWTVLVNGVDRHLDAVHDLLSRFRFVPDARLDDLMVSYATDTGGIGAHVDSYDVFLVQAHGRRRWRVAPPGDTRLVPGVDLKLLAQFDPTEDWILEPGDMLYVPPGWGHEGTAIGECITLSVGFRAPSRREFLAAFLAAGADDPGGPDPRFADRGRLRARHAGELPFDLVDQLRDWALSWKPGAAAINGFIGCWLTEPARDVWFTPLERRPAPARFRALAERSGLALDRRSRMAWYGSRVFLNGEPVATTSVAARRGLRTLADRRELDPQACAALLSDPLLAGLMHEWYCDGWLKAGNAPQTVSPTGNAQRAARGAQVRKQT